MSDPGMEELERIAAERTAAGVRCVAVKFATAASGQIIDLDGDGEVTQGVSVPLDDPEFADAA